MSCWSYNFIHGGDWGGHPSVVSTPYAWWGAGTPQHQGWGPLCGQHLQGWGGPGPPFGSGKPQPYVGGFGGAQHPQMSCGGGTGLCHPLEVTLGELFLPPCLSFPSAKRGREPRGVQRGAPPSRCWVLHPTLPPPLGNRGGRATSSAPHQGHPPTSACPQCLRAVGTMVAHVAPLSPPTASLHPNLFGSGLGAESCSGA